jgi:hypothetical protein
MIIVWVGKRRPTPEPGQASSRQIRGSDVESDIDTVYRRHNQLAVGVAVEVIIECVRVAVVATVDVLEGPFPDDCVWRADGLCDRRGGDSCGCELGVMVESVEVEIAVTVLVWNTAPSTPWTEVVQVVVVVVIVAVEVAGMVVVSVNMQEQVEEYSSGLEHWVGIGKGWVVLLLVVELEERGLQAHLFCFFFLEALVLRCLMGQSTRTVSVVVLTVVEVAVAVSVMVI